MAGNAWRLGGRFNAAKPLLYEVPTYLRWNTKQKNKKKKAMALRFNKLSGNIKLKSYEK